MAAFARNNALVIIKIARGCESKQDDNKWKIQKKAKL